MKIGVDIMGGDFAPLEITKGVIDALPHLGEGVQIGRAHV